MNLGSAMVALVTPMHSDGKVDFPCVERLIEQQLKAGVTGIIVGGTTGESATLLTDEWLELISIAKRLCAGQAHCIAGTGTNATQSTIEKTALAARAGADAALIVTPFYNKPTQEGLLAHYRAVAESVNLPTILYNVPGRTGVDMQPETVAALAEIDHIVGLKESVAEPERITALVAHCPANFQLLSGDDASFLSFMQAGGHGVISVAANVMPRKIVQIIHALQAGDGIEADMLNQQLAPLYEALFLESNPIPVKWLMSHLDMIGPGLRLPLTPLQSQYESRLINAYQAIDTEELA